MSLSQKFKSLFQNIRYVVEYFNAKVEGNEQYIQHLKSLKSNVTIKTEGKSVTIVGGKDILPPTIEKKEGHPLKVTSLDEYRVALNEGVKDFDFSDLNMDGENIQNLNLENLNLNINLREIFVPYGNALKCGNAIYANWGAVHGDCFLHLDKANLKGNQVEGDLSFFHSEVGSNVYFWYTADTFDDAYKEKYPQYFLDDKAPEYLKNKYYNPNVITKVKPTMFHPDGEEVTYLTRKTLSFEEYMEHYQFLTGKYLGNFSINEIDYVKINIIEKYGLEQAKEIFTNLSHSALPINTYFQLLAKTNELNLDNESLSRNRANNSLKVKQILQTIEKVKQFKQNKID